MRARPTDDLERGALLAVLSALFFAAMSAAVKAAAATEPNTVVVFFRNAVSLVALSPWLFSGGPRQARTRQLGQHLLRGLFGLAAMYLFFFAIGRIRLADAVLLNYTLPLFMPAIERAWLREPIPRRLWPPLAVGFVGIAVILRPSSAFHPVALCALASALLAAVAQVGIRRLTATEPVTRIVFYFALIATVVSALPLPWTWQQPTPGAWIALIASGLLATAGQLLLTRAYAAAPAAQVGPFLYTGVVFSGLFDWLLWRVLPDAAFALGALLVVAAAVLTLRLRGRGAPRAI